MFKHLIVGALALFFLGIASASGQSVCPLNGTLSSKLVCLIPQVYGPVGLGTADPSLQNVGPLLTAGGHQAHFTSVFTNRLGAINADVGSQVSQLPLASPSSGITFTYDPSLKTFTPSTDESLGPIIGERASTIGRHKLFVGFSYQYFKFDSIDGQKMSDIPVVLEHQGVLPASGSMFPPCPNQTGLPPGPPPDGYSGDTCYVRDFIRTIYNVDLRVNQYTVYFTYGLTRHLDLSLAMPFLNVRMDVVSNTTIVPNSVVDPRVVVPGQVFHQFAPTRVSECAGTPPDQACLNASFSSSGSATGIGDVVLRGKYEVYKGEKAGFALGMDVRLPSGDEENYLGSGAAGFKPFGVFSYRARVSPHVEVGYEVNGDSILAGNFVGSNTKGSLPNRLVYIVGVDIAINKRVTGAFDIYGQRLFGAPQLFSSPHTDFGKCSDVDCTIFTPGTTHPNVREKENRDFNITNASLGVKLRLIRTLVATGNVLLKLDDGGLRARVVPLVGVSYSF